MKYLLILLATVQLSFAADSPNIILMMCDDLGYGDTGFNGNKIIKTPHLDQMAGEGIVLTHFYSGNSVCSPTRGTCLTGRHHDRYGIYTANKGHLPKEEITISEVAKAHGYATGHFGKWHLGTLSKTMSSKGQRRRPEANFSPPWFHHYDTSFVTESAVTTWNPGIGKRAVNNPFFLDQTQLDGNDESLKGGAARVVMDRAVPFIEKSIKAEQPFFSVIWFHAPHEDIEAGPEYLAKYKEHDQEAAHYYGCITEIDDQVGRLRQVLESHQAFENTLIFFCSDNGPEGKAPKGRRVGVTGGLRGRKRALYDGGVRVPAFVTWPKQLPKGETNAAILTTLDYFPSIQKILDYQMPDARPIDGEDLMPILKGEKETRDKSIPFRYQGRQTTLVKGKYKYFYHNGSLFDLEKDFSEEKDIAAQHHELCDAMRKELQATFASIKASHSGADYPNSDQFTPVDKWLELKP